MDLKNYYASMSKMYFYQTVVLASGLSAFCLILLYIGRGGIFDVVVWAVWLYILYFFARYLYYGRIKGKISAGTGSNRETWPGTGKYVVQFPPGTKFAVQLYDGSGYCRWLLEEKASRRGVKYFQLQRKLDGGAFSIRIQQRNRKVTVVLSGFQISLYMLENTGKHIFFANGSQSASIRKNENNEIEFYRNDKLLAAVSRGIMPVAWQQIFSANIPVLRFSGSLDEEDQVLAIAFLAFFYVHDKYFV